MWVRSRLNFCSWKPNCSSTICWKCYFSIIKLLFHLCQKSIRHICVGLFFDSLVCSIDLCVCPLLVPNSLNYGSFIVSLKIRELISPTLFFFFKMGLAILIPVFFHLHFRNSLVSIYKTLAGIFDRNCIKPLYQFEENWYLDYVKYFNA